MKTIKWLALACLSVLAMLSCENQESVTDDEEQQEVRMLETSLYLSGYGIDTVITVKDFISAISEIKKDVDWLGAEIAETSADDCKIRIFCHKNATVQARKADVVFTFINGYVLTLKVTQDVVDAFEDIHNNVSDQPALAPAR